MPRTPKKSGVSSIKPVASPGWQAYQLYIELQRVQPKVWRRLLVPIQIQLPLLDRALCASVGWHGGHLHEFVIDRTHYGANEHGDDEFDDMLDESGVTLQEALGSKKTFNYIYDFGDDWCHKVKVEKIVMLDAPLPMARCLAGANACPPEDVGGSPGYETFLLALADPEHPEHDDYKEWIGGSFDPCAFDLAAVNQRLGA